MTSNSMNDQLALLREAAEWALIGLLFECPIGDWYQRVAALAADVADPLLREAAEWAQQESDQGLYDTTFGPGGPAAIRDVSYRDTVHPGPVLAELRGVYTAFAYTPALKEPPDHVAVQAGFIGYLRLKEAYARHCGLIRQADDCAAVAKWIVGDHISLMAQALAKSLEMSGIRYAAATAAALLERVGPPRTQAVGQMQVLECLDSGCSFSFDDEVPRSDAPAKP